MSLLHLIHKNIVIKFSDAGNTHFNAGASYVFRLTGVDGMGFIQIQDVVAGTEGNPEPTSDAYWINKDIVRELRELDLSKTKDTLIYTGVAPKPEEPVASDEPKPAKAKVPAKRTALKAKPILG